MVYRTKTKPAKTTKKKKENPAKKNGRAVRDPRGARRRAALARVVRATQDAHHGVRDRVHSRREPVRRREGRVVTEARARETVHGERRD